MLNMTVYDPIDLLRYTLCMHTIADGGFEIDFVGAPLGKHANLTCWGEIMDIISNYAVGSFQMILALSF